MGIVFTCEHCGRTLNVKDFLAGKRGICPKCGGRIEIPAPAVESGDTGATAAAGGNSSAQHEFASASLVPTAVGVASMVDPIAEAPQSKWFVLPAGSKKNYGPALGDAMRQWIREGRVGPDALVWREGWSEWRKAAAAFPQLAVASQPAASSQPSARQQASAAMVTPATSVAAVRTVVVAPNGSAANQAPTFELPPGFDFIPAVTPVSGPTDLLGSRARPTGVRRRSNTARNVILGVLLLAVVALVPALVWVVTHQ